MILIQNCTYLYRSHMLDFSLKLITAPGTELEAKTVVSTSQKMELCIALLPDLPLWGKLFLCPLSIQALHLYSKSCL